MQDIVHVLRVVTYTGPRDMVEEQVRNSLHGSKTIPGEEADMRITAVTVHEYPEVLYPSPRNLPSYVEGT